ncbi:hypothetical protein E2C01_017609 [Portunus trituberculatus]|uniref:Uncharacterized protein n=1 Tax=Portunus trituberculatus TaxID=210409 RepID=A0A5B7DUA4_PORTR|nr:hypothetical protein [Portunus trituberculatus]
MTGRLPTPLSPPLSPPFSPPVLFPSFFPAPSRPLQSLPSRVPFPDRVTWALGSIIKASQGAEATRLRFRKTSDEFEPRLKPSAKCDTDQRPPLTMESFRSVY